MGRSKGIAACQKNSAPSPAVFGLWISGTAGLRLSGFTEAGASSSAVLEPVLATKSGGGFLGHLFEDAAEIGAGGEPRLYRNRLNGLVRLQPQVRRFPDPRLGDVACWCDAEVAFKAAIETRDAQACPPGQDRCRQFHDEYFLDELTDADEILRQWRLPD